jgi:tRNA threonylcarbamoyladenosine biosynthesis protein TsaE
MAERTFITTSAASTQQLGARLADHLQPGDILLLDGELGTGKTQFCQGVGRALGAESPLISPTFNILLVYPTQRQATDQQGNVHQVILNHFDLYRLEDLEQLEDIDYFGTLADPWAINLVEWGSKLPDALPEHCIYLTFERLSATERRIIYRREP